MQVTLEESVAKQFRLQAKNVFLTWPQNVMSKEDTLSACRRVFPLAEFIVVAEEEHKSGDPHLHAIVGLPKRINWENANVKLDSITGKHGNYQSVRSVKATLRYVCKGGNYISEGVVPDFADKSGKMDVIARMINEGKSLVEVYAEHPGTFLLQKRKIEDLQQWVKRRKLAESLVKWTVPVFGVSVNAVALSNWLELNIMTSRVPRQKQLWLMGRPGIGKSRLLASLAQMLRVYVMPRDEDFYDEYEDGLFDLVVFDEFKSNKKIQFLNAWCDGQPLPLRQKGHQTMKNDNLPFIICSNFSIEECYHDGVGRDALSDRFIVVDFGNEEIVLK